MKPKRRIGIAAATLLVFYAGFIIYVAVPSVLNVGRIYALISVALLGVTYFLARKLFPQTSYEEEINNGPRVTAGRVCLLILIVLSWVGAFAWLSSSPRLQGWQVFSISTVLFVPLVYVFHMLERKWSENDSGR
ncbi:MAG: hypothetical protein ACJ74W_17200 [Pyrinomonadaceae bacterium]